MKSTKLMLNNWVKLPQHYSEGGKIIPEEYGQIISIHRHGVIVSLNSCNISASYDFIQPIEITETLLEKNNWKHHTLGSEGNKLEYWTSPDGRIELRSNKYHDVCNSDALWGLHIDNCDFESTGSGEVTYLHELQCEMNCNDCEFEWKF